ncbi:phosphatase PAP2 family protein [Thermococcus sp.]|uniref:phosphatase PAP2 family protein n=1 Tax=Thermococcus sp. TaxID=35749 RepID=UPI00261D1567|nr:phosphatase PAP2 family protein [Thermococcus sp.]
MNKEVEYKTLLVLTGILALLLTLQITGAFSGIDNAINSTLPRGGSFIGLLTDTASFALTAIYLILFALWDFKEAGKLRAFTLELTVGIVVSMVIVGLLKVLVGAPRPGEAHVNWGLLESIKNADYFAFPSGHTARAAVLAYFLSKRWRKLWPFWWGWAVVIALTRLLLHVHWFSDVLFALFLGPWAGLLVELTKDWWLPLYRVVVRKLRLGVLDVE